MHKYVYCAFCEVIQKGINLHELKWQFMKQKANEARRERELNESAVVAASTRLSSPQLDETHDIRGGMQAILSLPPPRAMPRARWFHNEMRFQLIFRSSTSTNKLCWKLDRLQRVNRTVWGEAARISVELIWRL